jgi:hypothetical protein
VNSTSIETGNYALGSLNIIGSVRSNQELRPTTELNQVNSTRKFACNGNGAAIWMHDLLEVNLCRLNSNRKGSVVYLGDGVHNQQAGTFSCLRIVNNSCQTSSGLIYTNRNYTFSDCVLLNNSAQYVVQVSGQPTVTFVKCFFNLTGVTVMGGSPTLIT